MVIDVTAPSSVLVDVDCDGDVSEWAETYGDLEDQEGLDLLCPGFRCEDADDLTTSFCPLAICCDKVLSEQLQELNEEDFIQGRLPFGGTDE